MPENIVPRSGPHAGAAGGRGKSAYQDRDKPAQIRFSNISAAKGIAARSKPWPSGLSCAFSLPVLDGHDSFSLPSDDPLWASHRISSVQGSSCLFSAHDFRPRVWRPLDLPYSASLTPIVFLARPCCIHSSYLRKGPRPACSGPLVECLNNTFQFSCSY